VHRQCSAVQCKGSQQRGLSRPPSGTPSTTLLPFKSLSQGLCISRLLWLTWCTHTATVSLTHHTSHTLHQHSLTPPVWPLVPGRAAPLLLASRLHPSCDLLHGAQCRSAQHNGYRMGMIHCNTMIIIMHACRPSQQGRYPQHCCKCCSRKVERMRV
jgi:hypothetical protein